MQILPGNRSDEALLQPEAFDRRVAVRGLPFDELRSLLLGEPVGRAAWRPGVTIEADLENAPSSDTDEIQTFDLEDGIAYLSTGCAGRVEVADRHELGYTLIPISLNLLLAQQWARAGLMMVHGAAFRFGPHGILALGDQGAGKSTLAAAALAASGQVVSDDLILVGSCPPEKIAAERLREFLMFRASSWSERQLEAVPELVTRPTRVDGKRVAEITKQPRPLAGRFPVFSELDQLWLLQPSHANRPSISSSEQPPVSSALAMLVAASMPLLFTRGFPAEYRALSEFANRMCADLHVYRIDSGTDLVTNSGAVLTRLVGSNDEL